MGICLVHSEDNRSCNGSETVEYRLELKDEHGLRVDQERCFTQEC